MSYPPQPAAPGGQPYPAQQPYGAPPPHYGQPPQPQFGYGAPQSPQPYAPAPPPPGRPPRRGLKAVLIVVGTLVTLIAVVVGAAVYHLANNKGPVDLSKEHVSRPWERAADGMTAALAAKDEEAFVKPFKGAELKEKQRKLFRNLVKIPWETARWETRYPAPLNGDMAVTFVHQVKGVDSSPVPEDYNWRLEQGDELITEVSGAKDYTDKIAKGSFYPAPWDYYEELAVETRDNLVVVADKGQAAELTRDIDVIAQAAKDDLEAWKKNGPATTGGREGAKGFFITLEKRREVYNKLYSGEGKKNDSQEAGVNKPIPAYGSQTEKNLLPGSSRIVMDSSLSRFTSSEWKNGVTEISRHEMGHAIVETLATEYVLVQGLQDTQLWVVEGFGDYMAFRGRDDAARATAQALLQGYRFDGTLPESLGFYAGQSQDRGAHYILGCLALRYMAQKYGEQKTLAFVAAHYSDPKQYKQQITDATGLTVEKFQSDWAAWVRSTVPGMR
ncbi:hypothetical protein [Kitasatospora sp. NPDC050543]|uniref:hypothetical protein n=1 Tax=Kitasatospora sp. NPDC050543 TaxID=3364054 RepID=UPI00379013D9